MNVSRFVSDRLGPRLARGTSSHRNTMFFVAIVSAALLASGCKDSESNPTDPASSSNQSPNYVIQNSLLTTVTTFTGANSITVGPSVVITSTADATLRTAGPIYFKTGVVILGGAKLRTIQ